MTEIVQNAISGVGGALVAGIYFVVAHWPKVKAGFQAATEVLNHLKANNAAVQSEQFVAQAIVTEDAVLRKTKIAAALHLLPQAIGVYLDKLKDVQAPVLAKLLNDHIPSLGGNITASEVTTALQLGSTELAALRDHKLLPTIREILDCIAPKEPEVTAVTEQTATAS